MKRNQARSATGKAKKRVLIVGQHFWPEAFRINDIADFLVDKECDVEVLCGIPNYPTGTFNRGYSYFRRRKEVHNGILIRRAFEIPRGSNTNVRIFINYMSFPLASLFHIPRLLTKQYDKLFLYQLSPVMMSIAGIIVGRLTKTETTMYVLDLWPENLFSVLPIKNSFLTKLVTGISHWHYRHVDKLVALSERMKERLMSISGISPERITVLPQTCEKIYEQDVHDEELVEKFGNGFKILFTGSITPAQSFETIIAAARQLKADGFSDINWIIVGDGMSRKWLEGEVRKAELGDRFWFEGVRPMEDIPKYTTVSDLLIGCLVKSDLLEATIPAKVMSYLAAGKPMVLAMDGAVGDLINHTIKCGFVGPSGNAEALAENIKKVHELSTEERKKLGERGRRYHFVHFERGIILNKLYNFIFS